MLRNSIDIFNVLLIFYSKYPFLCTRRTNLLQMSHGTPKFVIAFVWFTVSVLYRFFFSSAAVIKQLGVMCVYYVYSLLFLDWVDSPLLFLYFSVYVLLIYLL